jgi:hypothetical protein
MQERTKSKARFDFNDDGSFKLVQDTDHQTRRSDRENWSTDYTHPETKIAETLIPHLTRHQLADLLADGVQALSYVEEA